LMLVKRSPRTFRPFSLKQQIYVYLYKTWRKPAKKCKTNQRFVSKISSRQP
jgi:hypothetical protein